MSRERQGEHFPVICADLQITQQSPTVIFVYNKKTMDFLLFIYSFFSRYFTLQMKLSAKNQLLAFFLPSQIRFLYNLFCMKKILADAKQITKLFNSRPSE